jgi:DNA-binding transcriptional LysR family regulator
MTLDQLRIFVEVAEREHITRTAAALNMTQSAVSAAIQSLEARHNVTLFDRVGRSIVLNQAGRAFLAEARAVLAQAKAAEAALADLGGLMRGELSVMASQTVGAYWLPEKLAAYRQRWPGISLQVLIGNTHEVADAVEAGEVEIGIVEGTVDRPVISATIADTDEMIIVVGGEHPWRSQPKIKLGEGTWVVREAGSGTRVALETLLAREGFRLTDIDVSVVLPGNEAVLGAVSAGMGATLTSRRAASAGLKAGLLFEVPCAVSSRPFYLLRHKERYRSRAAAAFETEILRAGSN